jgi:uncharacterized OB-fold protein
MNLPGHWRLRNQRYALVGEICHRCGARIFPPRDVCPACADGTRDTFHFGGNGRGPACNSVARAAAQYAGFLPYTVTLVDHGDEWPVPGEHRR